MSKLTITQRKQLKDLCKETLIRKLSQKEAHVFVNSKLEGLGFDISFDYVQQLRSEISKSAKEELLTLHKDRYVLIQSLFFDRKDELIEMQKVLWHIVESSKLNPEIQIKAIEKLQGLTIALTELYHSLPSKVSFSLEPRPYIDSHNIKDIIDNNIDLKALMTPLELEERTRRIDYNREIEAQAEYNREFAELKKNNPTWSNQRIDDEIIYQGFHKSMPNEYPEPTLLENNPDFYKEEEKS